MTPRETALNAIIDTLLDHVEELGCTCPDGDTRNRLHSSNRRRRDSACTGVGLAVEHELRRRRANRQKNSPAASIRVDAKLD